MGNANLCQAKRGKNDEFYTRYEDIENELRHYEPCFDGKTGYCNCDDPTQSNFFQYFQNNFNRLGLRRLITTHLVSEGSSYKTETIRQEDENGLPVEPMYVRMPLEGDGDFRSPECLNLLDESDIVVTNPPFSLFREYVGTLVAHDKAFLIIGNQNAVTCSEVFPLIKEGRMWLGYGFKGTVAHFINTHYVDYAKSGDHREGMIRVAGVVWYTNLDHVKRHEPLPLSKHYNEAEYLRYDNCDAINVDVVRHIPCDYDGVMGVPITFLDKWCPDQFELLGMDKEFTSDHKRGAVNGERKYARLFIRRRS